ncbi:hypothetical protein PGTUg99_033360 [Puccinia graminis f. sp. tritici]|uniref:Uncharacterized protein n=1 Tax=Puccinia graminis f. sp. tritici TaxID=56615 RepID=A0A5B0QSY5_PUCGR|nr:hypothetical protein PGTUg99_033360 [Puccinia graminis f. sp. tritici]
MSRSTTTLNGSRSNAQTIGRRPAQTQAATPNDSTRSILLKNNSSLSQLKPSRSRLTTQSKNLVEPRTPATLGRRANNPSLNLLSGRNSPSQTPLVTIKRDGKSRLPRAAPTPTAQTPGISNPGTKKLRVKKSSTLQAQTATPARSSSSSLALTPEPPTALQTAVPKPGSSTHQTTVDPDATPKKPPSRSSYKQNAVLTSSEDQPSSKLPLPHTITRPTPQTSIVFPSIVEEQTPKRPMTRARSKQILDRSTSSLGVSPPEQTGIPQIKRKPSRVMQIAQAFQQESQLLTDGHSKNMLGVTPQRRPSNGSNTSAVSPTGSLVGNSSPNISALAASLSKQHGQRDRLSKARSSVTDMLRYSTMSTLGGLHWEDGAGEGLLTDPDETEAMVADISMSNTPLKPAVQSAAIALASARANFLTIVQENEQDPPKKISHKQSESSLNTTSSRIKKRPSFGFIPASTPLSRSRISGTSFTSNSPTINQQQQQQQMVIHETQLATLSASLERSQQRELELEKEIQKLEQRSVHENSLKKLSDQEREKALVEEIGRLEEEVSGLKELNIELENSLDSVQFDNLELRNKLDRLQIDHHRLLALSPSDSSSSSNLPPSSSITLNSQPLSTPNLNSNLPLNHSRCSKFEAFELEIVAEIAAIKDQLKLIQFIKISLALGSDLVSD